jgi:hypothetical protein
MIKLTEKEKAQLSDEERIIYSNYYCSMFKQGKKLVVLKNGYQYFIKNKGWILSLLFVLSIIRSSIWYACFGINILTYSSLQDIFISFANYFMSIIIIAIILISYYLFKPQNKTNKFEKVVGIIFSIIFLLFTLWIVLSLYRMIFSIIALLSIFLTLFSYWTTKMKISLLYFSLFWLLGLTWLQPMEQYLYISVSLKNYCKDEKRTPNINFIEQSAHYDYISFDYNKIHINTKTDSHYFIGCNSNYFFIFDKEASETLIIPKSECENIKSHPFGLKSLLFFR